MLSDGGFGVAARRQTTDSSSVIQPGEPVAIQCR
jgi:hypothetical protein